MGKPRIVVVTGYDFETRHIDEESQEDYKKYWPINYLVKEDDGLPSWYTKDFGQRMIRSIDDHANFYEKCNSQIKVREATQKEQFLYEIFGRMILREE